jgi:hypothetical protein
LLITLCISCHVRLHHYRGFSRWIPRVLLELWSEIHPGQPLQLQLPLAISARAADEKAGPARTGEQSRMDSFIVVVPNADQRLDSADAQLIL